MNRHLQSAVRRSPVVARLVSAVRSQLSDDAQARAASEAPLPPAEGAQKTFSHWGEDRVIPYLLNNKSPGFYVDIGCYHPTLASNTKSLFDSGWKGVNVDANPFMVEQFRQARPNDVNLNLAVTDKGGGEIELFLFDEWASSNTASPTFAEHISRCDGVAVKRRVKVPCATLHDILSQHCAGMTIDFMNIDVEALDLKVLQGCDWRTWRPTLVAIEDIPFSFAEPRESRIFSFMVDRDYRMVSRTVFTSFFMTKECGLMQFDPRDRRFLD